jgi:hypothetical protein
MAGYDGGSGQAAVIWEGNLAFPFRENKPRIAGGAIFFAITVGGKRKAGDRKG